MATLLDEECQLNFEETQALEKDLVFLNSNINFRQGEPSRSSSTSVSVRFRTFNSSPDFTLVLPQSAIQCRGARIIGFTAETATDIFRRFASQPDPEINCYDLLDHVHGHTSILSMASYQDCPPTQAMTQIGLKQQMQGFSAIFSTQTLRFWIDDTLRINYLTLVQLRRLKNHATGSIAKKKKAKRKTLPSSITTATLNVMPKDHYLPKNFVTVDKPGAVLEDHYVLYKAKAASDMGDRQWIQDDGSV